MHGVNDLDRRINKAHVVLFVCSTSDDNLLKNIELFDKLSLRFSGRVLFIKDVIGSSEICCWSFYGHGKKVAEVCCTSIVYATDKKHTKVIFHFHCRQMELPKESHVYISWFFCYMPALIAQMGS